MSVDVDPNHPQWPVPGMDEKQKRHFLTESGMLHGEERDSVLSEQICG